MKKYDCSCIGRICVDYISLINSFPKKNSKIPFIEYKNELGGQSAITATTISRLGLKVNLLSIIGNDQNGTSAINILKKENVNTKNIIKSSQYQTPIAFVWVEKFSAKRTIVYQKIKPKNIFSKKILLETFENSKFVFVDHQGLNYIIKHKKYLKKYKSKIIFDAERINNKVLKFLPYVNYLICSEDFVKEYKKIYKLKNTKETIKNISYLGAEIVCCTLGEKGSIAFSKNKFYFSKSIKVKAIDTTGAGDVFHGAFIFGLIKNWNIKNILTFANYVAGKSCTKLGGINGIPYLKDIPKKFLQNL